MANDNKKAKGLSKAEISAMKDYLKEKNGGGQGEGEVLARIKKMPQTDRLLAEQVHAIVMQSAPTLVPRLWYGMPAYSNSEGKVVCYFQDAAKFKSRYATFGFSDKAHLDDGSTWPVVFALKKLGPKEKSQIISLVKKAVR